MTGAKAYVHRYFVIIGLLVQFSVIIAPISITLLNVFMPCMPPFISSELFLTCSSWSDDGGPDVGVLERLSFALVAGYTWAVATGVTCFPIAVMLVYPVEVILLFIHILERFETE